MTWDEIDKAYEDGAWLVAVYVGRGACNDLMRIVEAPNRTSIGVKVSGSRSTGWMFALDLRLATAKELIGSE